MFRVKCSLFRARVSNMSIQTCKKERCAGLYVHIHTYVWCVIGHRRTGNCIHSSCVSKEIHVIVYVCKYVHVYITVYRICWLSPIADVSCIWVCTVCFVSVIATSRMRKHAAKYTTGFQNSHNIIFRTHSRWTEDCSGVCRTEALQYSCSTTVLMVL